VIDTNAVGTSCAAGRDMFQARAEVTTRILWLQGLTIAWMSVECGVAIYGAATSHSEVLLVFGADSFVELLSAALVLVATFSSFTVIKERATRATGFLLFLLAGLLLLTTVVEFFNGVQPAVSLSGIAITAAALIVMPVLAWMKRKAAKRSNNRALAADAVQSFTCFYLAATCSTFIGWGDRRTRSGLTRIIYKPSGRSWLNRGTTGKG
jgi:divalent metal cation (Fe/Co/Zn/Cd) transporter